MNPGDHPFIKHESFVDFSFTKEKSTKEIQGWVNKGTAEPRECLSNAVLTYVRNEAKKSKAMPRRFKRFVGCEQA
ncbi:MAG: hypothetical protein D6771_03310 [Zetaproteobacteria bacterium]|nr:MAG: hypothetical protein D6771_03310 [Zetaproteobacteria bacterium]